MQFDIEGSAFGLEPDPFGGFDPGAFDTFTPTPDPFGGFDPGAFDTNPFLATPLPDFSGGGSFGALEPDPFAGISFGAGGTGSFQGINPPFTLASPFVTGFPQGTGGAPFTAPQWPQQPGMAPYGATAGAPGAPGTFFNQAFPGPEAAGNAAFLPYGEPGKTGLFQAPGQDLTVSMQPGEPSVPTPTAEVLREGEVGRPSPSTPWNPWQQLTQIDARQIALALGLGGTAVGIIGLIQKMMQGDAASRIKVTRMYNEGTPEEKAAITAALQGMQQMAQSPTGGINPLDPAVSAMVEQAFQPQMQGIAAQGIEAGRRAGFHDNPLTSPGGAALAGPALAQLQGQMAAAKLGLAQAIAQQRMSGFQNMGGVLGNLQQTRGMTQTQQGPPSSLADLSGPLASIMANAGQGIAGYAASDPTRQAAQQAQQLALLRALMGRG